MMISKIFPIPAILYCGAFLAPGEVVPTERCGVVPGERVVADLGGDRPEVRADGAVASERAEGLQMGFTRPGGTVRIVFPKPWQDLSDSVVLEADIRNTSDEPATLLGELNNNESSKGFLHLPPNASGTMVMHLMRLEEQLPGKNPFPGMRGTPGGFMAHWDGRSESHKMRSVVFSDLDGRAVGKGLVVSGLRASGRYGVIPPPGIAGFFPFVDQFGQYKHSSWPGKIQGQADLTSAKRGEAADLEAHPGPDGWSVYGGWKGGPKLEGTGHFRTAKHGGKWWLVDPEGYLFWSHGTTGVAGGAETRVKWRKRFFESIPEGHVDGDEVDFLHANLERKYGAGWQAENREIARRRLRSWGMNSAGNWSEEAFCKQGGTPYFVGIHYGSRRGAAWKDAGILKEVLEERMAKEDTRDDPWCVGYFVDNELKWGEVMDPELYFKTVSEVMERMAPDKLYMGSRLHGHTQAFGAPKSVAEAAAKYCDVVGINRYRFSPADLRIPEGADKPIIVGEFHFGALDRGMLHPGLRGVGDQEQRAMAYRHFLTAALEHPNIVGAHWFQYRGQPVSGRKDGENFQIGFVDIADTPSPGMVEAARWVGERMYRIRAGK